MAAVRGGAGGTPWNARIARSLISRGMLHAAWPSSALRPATAPPAESPSFSRWYTPFIFLVCAARGTSQSEAHFQTGRRENLHAVQKCAYLLPVGGGRTRSRSQERVYCFSVIGTPLASHE